MKISFLFIHRFRGVLSRLVLYRMPILVVAIFTFSAIGAGAVLYFLAYQAPALGVSGQAISAPSVKVAKQVVEKIEKYVTVKKESSEHIPVYPDTVFYVPPVSQ